MRTFASCSWCHELNPTDRRLCSSCGHEAHVPRSRCSCTRCAQRSSRAASVDTGSGNYYGYTNPYMPLGGEE